jgi:ferric-dicitrate binding protein FerR (iron transport regulator)
MYCLGGSSSQARPQTQQQQQQQQQQHCWGHFELCCVRSQPAELAVLAVLEWMSSRESRQLTQRALLLLLLTAAAAAAGSSLKVCCLHLFCWSAQSGWHASPAS